MQRMLTILVSVYSASEQEGAPVTRLRRAACAAAGGIAVAQRPACSQAGEGGQAGQQGPRSAGSPSQNSQAQRTPWHQHAKLPAPPLLAGSPAASAPAPPRPASWTPLQSPCAASPPASSRPSSAPPAPRTPRCWRQAPWPAGGTRGTAATRCWARWQVWSGSSARAAGSARGAPRRAGIAGGCGGRCLLPPAAWPCLHKRACSRVDGGSKWRRRRRLCLPQCPSRQQRRPSPPVHGTRCAPR